MSQLSPVAFHGDTIYCVEHNGEPFAPLRPIIDNMGVDWGTQFRKLNDNKERWTVVIMTTVAADGCERETLCIPVRKLPAFLASINARKVRPELREKLIRYQNECDDALWNYWTQKHQQKARRGRPAIERKQCALPSPQPDTEALLRAWLTKVEWTRRRNMEDLERLNDELNDIRVLMTPDIQMNFSSNSAFGRIFGCMSTLAFDWLHDVLLSCLEIPADPKKAHGMPELLWEMGRKRT